MKECAKECILKNNACNKTGCRMWINYSGDLNCTFVTVNKNKGKMTLEEVSKRLDLSIVRIKQIQDKAIEKIRKNNPLLK